jgi:hypothetical protein
MPQKPVLQKSVKLNTAEGPESFCDNNTKLSDLSVRFFKFFISLGPIQFRNFLWIGYRRGFVIQVTFDALTRYPPACYAVLRNQNRNKMVSQKFTHTLYNKFDETYQFFPCKKACYEKRQDFFQFFF